MLKLRGDLENQVLFLSSILEPTLPKSNWFTSSEDYMWNYKKHVTWNTSDTMLGGSANEFYREDINKFKKFLEDKGIVFKIEEKFHNGLQCNTTRINISKEQILVEDI